MKPESVSVERIDAGHVPDYFVPHDRNGRKSDQYDTILEGLASEDGVIGVEVSYTSTLSVGWLQHHEAEIGSRTESTNHIALKLRLAKFLDELGHDCGRWSPGIEYESELDRWENEGLPLQRVRNTVPCKWPDRGFHLQLFRAQYHRRSWSNAAEEAYRRQPRPANRPSSLTTVLVNGWWEARHVYGSLSSSARTFTCQL